MPFASGVAVLVSAILLTTSFPASAARQQFSQVVSGSDGCWQRPSNAGPEEAALPPVVCIHGLILKMTLNADATSPLAGLNLNWTETPSGFEAAAANLRLDGLTPSSPIALAVRATQDGYQLRAIIAADGEKIQAGYPARAIAVFFELNDRAQVTGEPKVIGYVSCQAAARRCRPGQTYLSVSYSQGL